MTSRNLLPDNLAARLAEHARGTIPDIQAEDHVCWYCRSAPGEPSLSKPMVLHKVLMEMPVAGGTVTWQAYSVTVPKCSRCEQLYRLLFSIGAVLSSILPVYGLVLLAKNWQVEHSLLGWLVAGFWLVWILGACMLAFVLQMWILSWPGRVVARLLGARLFAVSKHLTDLKRAGWRRGEKPSSVE